MLRELREIVPGSLSVKTRSGIDDERQIFDVMPAFDAAGIDFLVVHSRTVHKKYTGTTNHDLTREIVQRSGVPVIANGDITTVAESNQVLEHAGGWPDARPRRDRGPLAVQPNSWHSPDKPEGLERQLELARHLALLLDSYDAIFHGDAQIMAKLKRSLP